MVFRGLNEREISKEGQTTEKMIEGERYADFVGVVTGNQDCHRRRGRVIF